jgi:hypothetical protein
MHERMVSGCWSSTTVMFVRPGGDDVRRERSA